ncbi:tetratricopeptide repeat protein [Bacteroidota bacterium]
MLRIIIFASVFLFSLFPLYAIHGHENIRNAFYQAYINNDVEEISVELDFRLKSIRENEITDDILLVEYGLIGYYIGNEKFDKARFLLTRTKLHVSWLQSVYPENSLYLALQGASCGFEIGMDWRKAFYLGPGSLELINNSIELNTNSPYGWIEKANAEYYEPKMLGRREEIAVEYYTKAIYLFEKFQHTKNWMYLNTMVQLGKLHTELGNYTKAYEIYSRLLDIEPDFLWVKNELLPKVKNQLKQ